MNDNYPTQRTPIMYNTRQSNGHADWQDAGFQSSTTPAPVSPIEEYSSVSFNEQEHGNLHSEDISRAHSAGNNSTRKDYRPVASTNVPITEHPAARRPRGELSRVMHGWWKEICWSLVSVACIPALIGMLRRYDQQPLPDWPHGITLNTAVAFISTLCRTAFVIPILESLSQLKWNWFNSPRPIHDFKVFDEASRGPFGTLKLLFATRARALGIISALVMVSSIATSTLTQSIVTYPTRMVAVQGDGTAVISKNPEYFWLGNGNVVYNTMAPLYRAVPQGVYTDPEDVLAYQKPVCRTDACNWDTFSSLAICVDTANVTDQLDLGGQTVDELRNAPNPSNITLPNGVSLQLSYGYMQMNTSMGTSLSFNGTDQIKASLFNYYVIFWPPLRAYEVLMHFCVNTYNASISDNLPSVTTLASHTIVENGPVFVKSYNQTYNATYLTTPDDPGVKYVADGYGPGQTESLLNSTLTGPYQYVGASALGTGVDVLGAAIAKWQGYNQTYDDQMLVAIQNVTQNVANSITNALLTDTVNGTALTSETYVSIRWEWISLLVAQVFLSILVLIIAILHTAWLGVPIAKGNPLPGLFAISAGEKYAIEQEKLEPKTPAGLSEYRCDDGTMDGELKRHGDQWVLDRPSGRRKVQMKKGGYVGPDETWI